MKNLKKSLLSGLGFIIAVGGVFALSAEGIGDVWRVTMQGGLQDVSAVCTYTEPVNPILCSSEFPSETANGDYFTDQTKTTRVPASQVFLIPQP